ncbi:peptide ABC transporter permease [Hyphomicrobium nitrativorans NL23]|uniref:Peptide ABC transporter permease n=1 Tax=Hyphomicrobium nitrativorans NL23 TaxID=1029756 RepID=V5SEW6_9HYPH|nr:ABC transporter permease [Hyphomicrobium nitrativorans]AHB49406.1 peptide ABC transporter permease [Hyphomicrobium nitrativorans NL23]
MSFLDSILIAINALRVNLLRSVLTTLGIVIGVASVIILVAVGTGASSEVDRQIKALGTNMLVVFPGSMRSMGRAQGAGTDLPLSEVDVVAIRDKIQGVVGVSGQLNETAPMVRGNTNWSTTVSGIHADYLFVRDWPLESGRDLTVGDVRSGARVAVIGKTVAKEIFPDEDPIGATVRITNVPFEIVGVLASKGQSAMGRDQDDVVLVPITTARARISGRTQVQNDRVGILHVKIDAGADMAEAQEEIESLLRQRRANTRGNQDTFSVRNLAETMKARTEVLTTMSYLLAATSVISLIVGGIGIMNIMLVSVTERTREIGLRMAVGGRRRDILQQFLVEAVSLCLLGGLIGIIIGVLASAAIAFVADWPILVSPSVLAGALAAAAATGICFGLFPARRAAYLNPIDALRSE